MLNYVWLGLVLIAFITGAFNGTIPEVGKAAVGGARTGVDIALGLVGIMALWLGLMKIAQEAGLITLLARVIRPLTNRLFPEIPPDHPALGSMVLNIAANWLGLGNAATPFGIKAMEELQTLNKSKDTATNSQVMFLTLNTASITLIPTTIIAVRVSAGSQDPFVIIGTTIFACTVATIVGVTVSILLKRLPVFRKTDPALIESPEKNKP